MEKTTNISNEESKKKDFEQICEGFGIDYATVEEDKKKYNLSDEDAIILNLAKI